MPKTERTASVAQIADVLQVGPIAVSHDVAHQLSIATDLQSYPLLWVGRIINPTLYPYPVAALYEALQRLR